MFKTSRLAIFFLSALFIAQGTAFAGADNLSAAGSTALLPLVKAAAEEYEAKYPDVKISVTGGGSRVGITQVAAKAVDLGDSDIIARGYPDLVDHRVAVVGFALAANPDVNVTNLSKQQIQGIFSGKIANWKDVGGKDEAIVIINRPRSSGTRAVFTHTLMGDAKINESGLTEDATGTVISALKTTPGAISYVAFSGLRDQSVRVIAIDGVQPIDKNVTSGKYPFWSYEHIFTNGNPAQEASRFLDFVAGNAKLVRKLGYIPVKEMKATENDR